MTRAMFIVVGLIAAAAAIWLGQRGSGSQKKPLAVAVPTLTPAQMRGELLFKNKCALCHGKNAAGSGKGPPLIHTIYEPNHHGDLSFYRAARYGVRAHHWQFGDMPPVAGVRKNDVRSIVAYVRALQKANGIF